MVSHHFPIFSWPVKAVGAGYVRLFNAELQQLIAVRGTQACWQEDMYNLCTYACVCAMIYWLIRHMHTYMHAYMHA